MAGLALALAQIGQGSSIPALIGTDPQIPAAAAMNVIVGASIISIGLNPAPLVPAGFGLWSAWRCAAWQPGAPLRADARTATPCWRAVSWYVKQARGPWWSGSSGRDDEHRCAAKDNGIEPSIIELNMDTVRELREGGIQAVYGDASHRATLEEAGLADARHLILTADVGNSEDVIREARDMNRQIHVLARTNHLRGLAALRAAGAEGVFSGEAEVALAMTEAILQRLGATAEQVDRERERVHSELLG